MNPMEALNQIYNQWSRTLTVVLPNGSGSSPMIPADCRVIEQAFSVVRDALIAAMQKQENGLGACAMGGNGKSHEEIPSTCSATT